MSRKKLSHVSCSPHFRGVQHILTQMSSFLPTSVSNTQALTQLTVESRILTTSTPRRPGVSSHSPPAVVAWAIRYTSLSSSQDLPQSTYFRYAFPEHRDQELQRYLPGFLIGRFVEKCSEQPQRLLSSQCGSNFREVRESMATEAVPKPLSSRQLRSRVGRIFCTGMCNSRKIFIALSPRRRRFGRLNVYKAHSTDCGIQ